MIYKGNIFSECNFINEAQLECDRKKNEILDECASIVLEDGSRVNGCDMFISDEMINECFGNAELIKQSALLEGAKMDWGMKNLFKEGKDYKGLKKDVNEIISANNLSKDELRSKGKGFMHICKRILQVCEDLSVFFSVGTIVGNTSKAAVVIAAGATPVGVAMIISTIVGGVIGFIINRLFRYLYDTAEFSAIKKDAEDIVSDLRRQAKKTDNKKYAEKLNKEADKLEDSIAKYSKKNN